MARSELASPLLTFVSILLAGNIFVVRQINAEGVYVPTLAPLASTISIILAGFALMPIIAFIWSVGADRPPEEVPTPFQLIYSSETMLKISLITLFFASYSLISTFVILFGP